jgi:hypothetical protein
MTKRVITLTSNSTPEEQRQQIQAELDLGGTLQDQVDTVALTEPSGGKIQLTIQTVHLIFELPDSIPEGDGSYKV